MDPTLPIEDVTAAVNTTALGYFQSFDFFGRFANIGLSVPYAWGSMQGLVEGEFDRITRSGLGDPRLRFAFNLVGAPAFKPVDSAKFRQKTNIGLSLSFVAPLGQHDANKLINLGSNRWALKPELGLSHLTGRWLLEAAGGVWLFGANDRFLGTSKREQSPVLSVQGHITYNLPKRMWVGFDANFFTGGGTRTDGVESSSPSLRNSRLGVTFSLPIYRRHSFKISYDNGVLTRLGGDFSRLSVGYQFVWLGLR
jgi:hypothetical protein